MKYDLDAELIQVMVDDSTEGFAPCPTPILEILQTWVARSEKGGTICDNCAGDGDAAYSLAQAWGLRPVLIEPHPGRHALCLRYDDHAVQAPAQHVIGRGPTVWFFNPPYDPADNSGSMERHLLKSATGRLPAPLTLCVWLLPQRMLSDGFLTELVTQHLDDVRAFQFPPAWADYRQIAIMGYWMDRIDQHTAANGLQADLLMSDLPGLACADRPYALKAVGADFSVRVQPLANPVIGACAISSPGAPKGAI